MTDNNLRVFFVGGYLSYRALFNWMHPTHYIPTMLGAPVFQVLFFAYIGRFAQLKDDTFFVTGNAVQLTAMAGVYGMAMTIGGERWTQTLSPLMASPANRLPLFLGRSLPLIVNGIITSAFAFFVSWLLLDFELTRSQLPALAVVVAVSAFACTSLGLLVGAIGLRGAGRLLPREPRRLLAAPLLRRERPARDPAGLDGGRRPGAAPDPRDRGGA